jgi:hypothetical protein
MASTRPALPKPDAQGEYPAQAKLLSAVVKGPCLAADELPAVPDAARKPPSHHGEIRDDVAFFQAVRAALAKLGAGAGAGPSAEEELDHAIRQIVSRAVASDKVIDIFSAAGLKKPDISILAPRRSELPGKACW